MHRRDLQGGLVRRLTILVSALAVISGALVFGANTASATTTTSSNPVTLSGSTTLPDASATSGGSNNGDIQGSVTLGSSLSWSQPSVISVTYDPNLVRQGRSLDPTVAYTRVPTGTMTVNYSLTASACFVYNGSCYGFNFGPLTFTASGPCDLVAGGANYTCHLESNSTTVFQGCPDVGSMSSCPLSPEVTAKIVTDVTVSPDTLHSLRTASFSGTPAGTAHLQLMESPITDALAIPCSAAVGDSLSYQLGDFSATDGLAVSTGVQFDFKISSPVGIPPLGVPFPYIDLGNTTAHVSDVSGSIGMSGSGFTVDMGTVQHNNIPPSLTVASSFSGNEGDAIPFAASAAGPCAAGSTYVWSFSDGGTAFGANTTHVFTNAGPYSGNVTVTDSTGLTASSDFSVSVANLPPVVAVLPTSATVAWGRDLTVSAQAVDPGSTDLPLTYAWDFGDATPVVIGGVSETHQWTTPGSYTVTVTVCDTHAGCTVGSIPVTVRLRTTSLAYTGDNAGTYSGTSTLSGSLVDEFGQPVNSGVIAYNLGGSPAGTATTNASGVASRSQVILLSASGSPYVVGASFAGNALYQASTAPNESFSVGQMGTVITYTGATSGKPNSIVPLSATLTDALGRPLAGRTVTFKLGAQTITGTTSSTGVVAVSLKLIQKPGIYPLTVSWPGSAGFYNAATTTTSFKLNTK